MNNIPIEEALEEYGVYSCKPYGTSMYPTINTETDTVVLKKLQAPPKKYDVLLYKRKSGECVLHRVIEVGENSYTMCGDNQWVKEKNVPETAVIAVMDGFFKGERYVSCASGTYKSYVKLWCLSLTARKFILKVLWKLKSLRKNEQ